MCAFNSCLKLNLPQTELLMPCQTSPCSSYPEEMTTLSHAQARMQEASLLSLQPSHDQEVQFQHHSVPRFIVPKPHYCNGLLAGLCFPSSAHPSPAVHSQLSSQDILSEGRNGTILFLGSKPFRESLSLEFLERSGDSLFLALLFPCPSPSSTAPL